MAKTVFSAGTLIKSADINANFDGAYDGTLDTTANSLISHRDESHNDHVISGATINTSASLAQTTTSGVFMIDGYRLTIGATAKTYTASKDTYVDVLRSGSTASYVYTEVANNAASPALAANSIRVARVVTSGSAITLAAQAAGDSLGNEIYPLLPESNIAWRQWISGNTHIGTGASAMTGSGGSLTLGNGTLEGYYQKIGKTINVRVRFVMGSTSSVSGMSGWMVALPFPNATTGHTSQHFGLGSLYIEDYATFGYYGFLRILSTQQNKLYLGSLNSSGTYVSDGSISATVPFTWGTNDYYALYATYEAL